MRPVLVLLLAVVAASAPRAQHHAAHHHDDSTPETFSVDGLRVDPADPPPGSAVGRAGLRFVDGGYVSVVYGKPYRRGRTVVGGVVGYDTVWVAGAHRATELWTTVPLLVGDVRVEPGGYSLFVTPRADRWTVHLNRSLGMHLADDYNPALDVVAVDVAPEALDTPVDALTWAFSPAGDGLQFRWDRTTLTLPLRRADR